MWDMFHLCVIECGHSGCMEDCALTQVKGPLFPHTWGRVLGQHSGTIIAPSPKLNFGSGNRKHLLNRFLNISPWSGERRSPLFTEAFSP